MVVVGLCTTIPGSPNTPSVLSPMATLNMHAGTAMSLCGLSATSLLVGDLASTREATLYFVLGSVGGLLPDLDSDHSRSLRVGFFLASLLAAFSTVFALAARLTLAELVTVWITIFFLIRYGMLWIFTRLTRHRGMFHSIPAALLCGFATAAAAHHYFSLPAFSAWMSGAHVTLGYVVHLVLDEIYSIDLGGVKVRRSFGTALKVFSRRSWRMSILLYGVTAFAFYLTPDMRTLSKVIVDDQAYTQIFKRLIPSGNWFASVSGPISTNPR